MRTNKLAIALSDEELEMIKLAAENHALKPSTFCRMIVMQEVTKNVKKPGKSD